MYNEHEQLLDSYDNNSYVIIIIYGTDCGKYLFGDELKVLNLFSHHNIRLSVAYSRSEQQQMLVEPHLSPFLIFG